MKRILLDRLLASEVLGKFAFAVSLFTTILVAMTELQQLTSMVVEHHVPVWTAVRIFALSLPRFISLAFPMAALLATMLAFGRLSEDYEVTALTAA
ncbi:MAG: LptF/LptG family permease, partial [Chloroflexi bacterium]|nr:LptF/LptG family permease [Chloroflexota bacterium]